MQVRGEAQVVRDAAGRHGFSEDAVHTLLQALKRSGGTMAQFSDPELGGMGQWSQGGMLMIGDMFNDALKARVGRLAEDLSRFLASSPPAAHGEPDGEIRHGSGIQSRWWPAELGEPASSGGQDGVRYAFFPRKRRLAIERDGRITMHDTLDHLITGVSQSQGGATVLRFRDADGTVELERLPVVS